MPTQFLTQEFPIESTTDRTTISRNVAFTEIIVGRSAVAINGFSLRFDGDPQKVEAFEVNVDKIDQSGNVLTVEVDCNLQGADSAVAYSGSVVATVMAEVA